MRDDPGFVYVEDDPISRHIMKTLLCRLMPFENVAIFEDSADFMPRLESLSFVPEVFFLDIHMEPYDGFALLDMLRQDTRFADSMVIAVTASVMNEEVEQLHDAGFDGGIAKPIDQMEFPGLIERILQKEKVWFVK